jgi:hypothetical protein
VVNRIVIEVPFEDNHIPEWVFTLAHKNDVFVRDKKTGELMQVPENIQGHLRSLCPVTVKILKR